MLSSRSFGLSATICIVGLAIGDCQGLVANRIAQRVIDGIDANDFATGHEFRG